MWRMVQEGGFAAMIAMLLGIVGLAAAVGSLVTLAVARRMAFAVGLGAIALALMAAAIGAAGVLLGWHSVDTALAALGSGAEFQRIRIVGYAEARSSGRIGFAAALALGTWPLPENTYVFDVDDGDAWELAAATEHVAEAGTPSADRCDRLELALDALREHSLVPLRFRRDPATLVPSAPGAATRCAKARFDELAARRGSLAERETLLASSLLVDEELARAIAAYEPPPQRPVLPTDSPPSTGRLAPETIRKVIKTQSSAIAHCYERALSLDPSLAGRVELSFTIEPSGEVKAATIAASTLKDADVESCILGRIRTLTFPKPQGGSIAVKYPFVFEPAR